MHYLCISQYFCFLSKIRETFPLGFSKMDQNGWCTQKYKLTICCKELLAKVKEDPLKQLILTVPINFNNTLLNVWNKYSELKVY